MRDEKLYAEDEIEKREDTHVRERMRESTTEIWEDRQSRQTEKRQKMKIQR